MISVTAQLLRDRINAIGRTLEQRSDALALLALGSIGRDLERLDAWSDLDFFVFVRDGAKDHYIHTLDWLAAAHPLVWAFQNTVDGCKALMADGVFCEFAVFELHELSRIPYAPGRFVWKRDEVSEALAAPHVALPGPRDEHWLLNEALSNLIVGLQRLGRGEKLAAMRMVQVHALDLVLELLEQRASSDASQSARDPFDLGRRIEKRRPDIAAQLPVWAGGYESTPAAALALLEALERTLDISAAAAQRIRTLAAAAR